MGRPRKTIRVRVRRAPNITDNFVTIYNDLPRGAGEWAGLSAEARILLISGLSCRDGWDDATMESLEGWLPELGRDRQEAVRRELRERGFMTLRQQRIASGPEAGMFEWEFEFHMHALPAEQRDVLKAKTAQRRRKKNSIPGTSGNGEDQTVSAGDSTPGFSGHEIPGNGGAGTGGQGGTPYIEKNYLEKEQTPLPPSPAAGSPAVVADAEEGGDSSEKNTKPAPTMDAVVAWLLRQPEVGQLAAKYRNWEGPVIAETLTRAITDGRGDLRFCSNVLLTLAKSGRARSARLLLENGPWWTAEKPFVPAPAPADAGPRCQKPGHTGPAEGCIPCASEAKAARLAAGEGAVNPRRSPDAEAAFQAGLARARAATQTGRVSRDSDRVAA